MSTDFLIKSSFLPGFLALNFVAQYDDGFDRFHRRTAIVFFLRLWKLFVRHQARVFLQRVVSLRAVGPSLGHAPARPDLVDVSGQHFGQPLDFAGESDVRGVNGPGFIATKVQYQSP